jgi:hypothetical protein
MHQYSHSFDGMNWPLPSNLLGKIAWSLRYGDPTHGEKLIAASVISAYHQMVVFDTAKKRNMVVRKLRARLKELEAFLAASTSDNTPK